MNCVPDLPFMATMWYMAKNVAAAILVMLIPLVLYLALSFANDCYRDWKRK